jgi:hypothetical protein
MHSASMSADETFARQIQMLESRNAPLCRHFRQGYCRDGADCAFSHTLSSTTTGSTSYGGGASFASGSFASRSPATASRRTPPPAAASPPPFGRLAGGGGSNTPAPSPRTTTTASGSLYHALLAERKEAGAFSPSPATMAVAASSKAAGSYFAASLRTRSPGASNTPARAGVSATPHSHCAAHQRSPVPNANHTVARGGTTGTSPLHTTPPPFRAGADTRSVVATHRRADMAMDNIDQLSYEQLLELQERIGHVKVGLTPQQISRLPLITLRTTSALSTQAAAGACGSSRCVICCEDYAIGDALRLLPCRHGFHQQCIDAWLDGHKKCPVCQCDVAEAGASVGATVEQLLATMAKRR